MPANTVLLTGATGFVGAHAAEAFALHGVAVRALVRPTSDSARLRELGATVVAGQLTDTAAVQRAAEGADAVVHMAALTKARSAAEYDAVNEEGTRALLEALAAMPVRPRRVVYLSSLAAVGPSAGRPVDATSTPQPLSAYGRSKLGGERACAREAATFEVVVLRAPAVYGPGDRELLPFFRLARHGLLPIPGDAGRPLQLIHVQDLAATLVQAATRTGVRGVYHAAESRVYRWSDVVEQVAGGGGGWGKDPPAPIS
jgi:dihydroflavonol-4-reductase